MDWVKWFDQTARKHPWCPEYLGLTVAEVTKRVDPQRLRVIDTNEAENARGRLFLTSDLRPDRVNVLVQNGVITAAARF